MHQEIRSGEVIAPNSEGETFVVSPSPDETLLQTAPPLCNAAASFHCDIQQQIDWGSASRLT